MKRDELKFGQRVTLFCDARNGYVTGLPSALSPLGVANAEAVPSFEQAVFILMSPEGDPKEPRHVGEPIKFGSVLRLYHSWQHKCITHHSNLVSHIDRSNQRVTLEDIHVDSKQRSTWNRWRVLPRYKVRAEGDFIADGDHVVFQLSTSGGGGGGSGAGGGITSSSSTFLQVSPRRDESIDMCYELHAGGIPDSFSLHLYDEEVYIPKSLSGYIVESPELRCGDCILFQHKEERSNLVTKNELSYFEPRTIGGSSSRNSSSSGGGGGALSSQEGDLASSSSSSSSLRFSMCVIEHENPFKGGVVRSGVEYGYRLKDLRSGQYLVVTSIAQNDFDFPSGGAADGRGKKNVLELEGAVGVGGDGGASEGMLALTLGSDRTTDASIFMFHDTIDEEGRALVQCCKVYIQCRGYGGVWLVAGEAMKGTVETRMTRRVRRCVRFVPEKSPGDGIELHRIPSDDHQQLNMILLPLPPIISFVASNAPPASSPGPSPPLVVPVPNSPVPLSESTTMTSSEWSKLPQVHENLLQLNRFCSSAVSTSRAQRLLHEQGVTALCIAVCQRIMNTCRFTTEEDKGGAFVESPQLVSASAFSFGNMREASMAMMMSNFMSINVDRLLSTDCIPGTDVRYRDAYECAKQAFTLIGVIVKHHSEHAVPIAKDILFLIECSCFCDEAATAVMACLDRNMALVDTPNELDFVNAVCEKIISSSSSRSQVFSDHLFNILALLASCGPVGLPAAQQRICSVLLRDAKVATEIFLPISLVSGVVHFTVPAFVYDENINNSNGSVTSGSHIPLGNGSTCSSSNPSLVGVVASSAITSSHSGKFRRGGRVVSEPPSPTTPRTGAGWQISLPSLMASIGQRVKFPHFLKLLTGQIDLFAALVRGRNQIASASLVHVIPMEALLPCIQDPSLPPSLRAALLRLCAAWAVDGEGSPNVLETCTTLCYVVEEHLPIAIEYDLPTSLKPIKEFALDCLLRVRTFSPMTALSMADLALLHAAMDTVAALFARGAFRLREYQSLLTMLARILVQWPNDEDHHLYLRPQLADADASDRTSSSSSSVVRLRERVYDIRQQALTIIDTMITFLVSKDALDVIHRFANGLEMKPLSQMANLNPLHRTNDATGVVNATPVPSGLQRGQIYSVAGTPSREKPSEREDEVVPAKPGDEDARSGSGVLATLLRSILYTSSACERPLALNAIRIFWRLTNYPRDLEAACATIQLLATGRSEQYFKQVKVHCNVLARLSTTVLSIDQIPRCLNAVSALQSLLASSSSSSSTTSASFGGTMHEKILMMKNLRLAPSLLSLLSDIPVPLEEPFIPLVTRCFSVLAILVQEDALASIVATDIEKIVHLILYDPDTTIPFLSTLYARRSFAATIEPAVVREIVNGLAHEDLALRCIRLLIEVVATKDEVGRYHNHVQHTIWRSIQGSSHATSLFRFRDRWCGKGKYKRDAFLASWYQHQKQATNTNNTSTAAAGGRPDGREDESQLQLHLGCVTLIYLILKKNDLTRHTEVRHALFGLNATDEILEVISNTQVPMIMRSKYVQLLTVLILRDKSYRASFYAHRGFLQFLTVCSEDIVQFRKCLGDAAAVHGDGGAVQVSSLTGGGSRSEPSSTEGESGTFTMTLDNYHPQPNHQQQQPQDQPSPPGRNNRPASEGEVLLDFKSSLISLAVSPARHDAVAGTALDTPLLSIATHANHLLNDLSMALKDIFDSAGELPETIFSPVVFEKTMRGMNLLIDQLSAFVKFVFVSNDYTKWSEIQRMDKGRRRLKTALIAAQRQHLCGTTQWSTDFAALIQRIAVGAVDQGEEDANQSVEDIPTGISTAAAGAGAASTLPVTSPLQGQHGKNLSDRWQQYYEAISTLDVVSPAHVYASAAGFILRSGYLGSKFVYNAGRLASGLSDAHTIEVMKFTSQVLHLREENSYDECASWNFSIGAEKQGGGGEEDDGEDHSERFSIQPLMLEMSLEDRQNVVASWSIRGGERMLPCMILLLSSDNDDVFEATIRAVIGLLDGGNRNVQDDIFHWLASRADEVLFFILRNRLLVFLEHVRQHQRLLAISSSRKALTGGGGGSADSATGRLGERLNFKAESERARSILRFMHLLCEGHHSDLQNYLRIQPDNQLSVNVIEPMLAVLALMVTNIEASSFDTLLQLLFTIAEALQGPCPGNQEVMVSLGIGESLAAILALRTTALSGDQLQQLYFLSAIVLRSLLEGRTSPVFISLLLKSASLMSLIEAMDRSYESYQEESLGEEVKRLLLGQPRRPPEYGDALTVGTELLIFLRACLDIQDRGRRIGGGSGKSSPLDFTDKYGVTIRSALRQSAHFKQINQLIGVIEIARGEGVEKVYFRIPAVSIENLREDSKEQLIKQVARDSDNARISDFFDRCNKMVAELEYYESLRRTPGLALIQAHVPKLQVAGFVLAIILNLYMIIALTADILISRDWSHSTEMLVMQILGGFQMVIQVLLFVYFFFGPMKVRLDDTWGRWQDELNSEAIRESRAQLSVAPPKLNFHRVEEVTLVFYLTRSLWTLMAYNLFWMRLVFLFAGIAGFFWTPEWYSVQLLQVIQFSPQLHIVVLSVTKHGSALLLTFAMLLIVVYILTAISFQYYAQYYNDIKENFSCHSVFQCFLINLSDGLRLGGGIGEGLPTTNYHTRMISRSLYDFVFFLLCQLMFLKLVFGIIVDTFAELREGREAIEEDQETKCFICGISSNEFDRADPGGFEHHVKAEHNMWNYVFFMHFLRMKPKEELNGAEDYCLSMIQESNVAFFPIGKATTLERRSKKDQEEEVRDLITR